MKSIKKIYSLLYILFFVSSTCLLQAQVWNEISNGEVGNCNRTIWGTSNNNIYAGGQGGLYHFNGANWTQELSQSIEDIWGTSPSNVYAVGSHLVYHYNGIEWQEIFSFDGYGTCIWGLSNDNIYLGTANLSGTCLWHFNGTSWESAIEYGSTEGIWGTSPSNIYVTSLYGYIQHFDGTNWTLVFSLPPGSSLHQIKGNSANDIYVGSNEERVYHFNGTTWELVYDGDYINSIWAIWCNSPTDIYAGDWEYPIHFDGTSWSNMSFNPPSEQHNIRDFWSPNSGADMYAVSQTPNKIFKQTTSAATIDFYVDEVSLTGYSYIDATRTGQLDEVIDHAILEANTGSDVNIWFDAPGLVEITQPLPAIEIINGSITFNNYYTVDPLSNPVQGMLLSPGTSAGALWCKSSTQDISIKNLTFNDFTDAIEIDNQNSIEIINCDFNNIVRAIRIVESPIEVLIDNCNFTNNDGYAFNLGENVSHFICSNNTFTSSKIEANYITNNSNYEFISNLFEQTTVEVIRTCNLTSFAFSQNTLNDNSVLHLSDPEPDWILTDNEIHNALTINSTDRGLSPVGFRIIDNNTIGYAQFNTGNTFGSIDEPCKINVQTYMLNTLGDPFEESVIIVGQEVHGMFYIRGEGTRAVIRDNIIYNTYDDIIIPQIDWTQMIDLVEIDNSNDGIQPPTLTGAVLDAGDLTVEYTVSALNSANSDYIVDFYKSNANGDFIEYLGNHTVSNLNGINSTVLNGVSLVTGDRLAATLTSLGDGGANIGIGTSQASYINVTITNPIPSLSIDNITLNEGNTGQTTYTFTVSLSATYTSDVTVDFNTIENTATLSDNDYDDTFGTLIFASGETTKTITVYVNGDGTEEIDEQFFVDLSNASNATIAVSRGIGTINNDDGVPIDYTVIYESLDGVVYDPATKTGQLDDILPYAIQDANNGNDVNVWFDVPTGLVQVDAELPTIEVTNGSITFNNNSGTEQGINYTANNNINGFYVSSGYYFGPYNSSIQFKNLKISNFNSPISSAIGGIRIASGYGNISMENCIFENCEHGIYYGNVGNLIVNNCNFINNDRDIGQVGVAAEIDIELLNNVFNSSVTVATWTANCNINIHDNQFLNSGIDATRQLFDIQPNTKYTINNNLFSGPNTYLAYDPEIQDVFTNNIFDNCMGLILSTNPNPESGLNIIEANTLGYELVNTGNIFDCRITCSGTTNQAGNFVFVGLQTSDYFFITSNLINPRKVIVRDCQITTTLQDRPLARNSGDEPIILPPTINSAEISGQNLNIEYTTNGLNSNNGPFVIDFYVSNSNGDLVNYIGEHFVQNLNDINTTSFSPISLSAGDRIAATVTSLGNTSGNIGLGTSETGYNILTGSITVFELSINNMTISEGNSGTVSATFTVSLSNSSSQTISVEYSTLNGSATTTNNDYVATSNTLAFNPGETSKTISVTINGDTDIEPDEIFYVNLSNPVNATIADGQGVGTIVNDDYNNTTQPVAHWPANECSGNMLPDNIGTNDGIILGTPNWTEGYNNQSLSFDGSTNYVSIPGDGDLSMPQQNLTAALWFKSNHDFSVPTEHDEDLLFKNTNYYIQLSTVGTWGFKFEIGLTIDESFHWIVTGTDRQPELVIRDNLWHHIALTYDGTSGITVLYIDGTAILTKNLPAGVVGTPGMPSNNIANVHLGAGKGKYSSAYAFFNGNMDEINIFNETLTPAEIGDLYNIPNIVQGCGGTKNEFIHKYAQQPLNEAVSIFPNPVGDILMIESNFAPETSFYVGIYDYQGRKIKEFEFTGNSNVINVDNLHPGLYLVRVTGEGKQTNTTIVKK